MTAGRKRRPAATSSRQATQEALPLAPPAAPEPMVAPPPPAAPVTPEPRPSPPARELAGTWLVLWVRCEGCGKGRHVDVADRHGAMPVRASTRAEHPVWPHCTHSVPHWENCRGTPVAPPCCLEG